MENMNEQILDVAMENNNAANVGIPGRTMRGFKLILLGSLILVGGCISTLVLPSDSMLYEILLYGFTSLGATLIIYGFYCVLE